MKIGIIGCGYVADYYAATSSNHPQIELVSAYDLDEDRTRRFSRHYGLTASASLDDMLSDPQIEMIWNLTNPNSHFAITKRCLQAGKHVYSEKPLAMNLEDASKLVLLAKGKGLCLGAAPCSFLSDTAQSIKAYLNDGLIGDVRLIYAAYETHMTHLQAHQSWTSPSGAKWPARDEFQTGCTYEHAGYFLSWLAEFFGSAKSISSFSSCQIKDKGMALEVNAPDFSVGCIEYRDNIVARVTSSIVAPTDKSITIMGERGTIFVKNMRDDRAPIYYSESPNLNKLKSLEYRLDGYIGKIEKRLAWLPWSWGNTFRFKKSLKLIDQNQSRVKADGFKAVDFCLGPAEMIDAITCGRDPRISPQLALHVTELTQKLQYPRAEFERNCVETSID